MFGLLAALHVFWALGGRPGLVSTIPTVGGLPAFSPGPLATVAVALALCIAAGLVLGRAGLLAPFLPAALFKWPMFALGLVFLARAVGEFRLVGLFKRVRGTSFARWDTFFYSPLCLAISFAALWLALRSPERT